MRAALIYEHGGPEKLQIGEVPRPEVGPGEVLVAVKACGLNHLDIFVRRGMPGLPVDMPRIGGGDVAGVIASLGSGVNGLHVGQRVVLNPMVTTAHGHRACLGEETQGGLAEYIKVPAENAIPLPDDVSFEVAASLPISYGTAWRMLRTRGQLQAGESILILGAAGGVGTGAVQIAKMVGATVFVAASTDEKLQRLKDLGADVLINYGADPDFHRAARKLTQGRGVDVVVDFVGAATWVHSLKSLRHGGRLLTCGATTGYDPKTDIRFIWTRELNIIGSNNMQPEDLAQLLEAVRAGQIKPVVDRVLPLDQIQQGHRLIEERAVFGKVVMQV